MLQKSVASASQEPRKGWAAFSDGLILFFHFAYPSDLSLTHKQGLVIWQYWTPTNRMDKLCLVVVANEFAALNDNRKDNFGTFKESDLKMSWWHSTVGCVCADVMFTNWYFYWQFQIWNFPGGVCPRTPLVCSRSRVRISPPTWKSAPGALH